MTALQPPFDRPYEESARLLPTLVRQLNSQRPFYILRLTSEGLLEPLSQAQYLVQWDRFSCVDKIKNFLGFGQFGYFTLESHIRTMALRDRLSSNNIIALPPNPTMQDYFRSVALMTEENRSHLAVRNRLISYIGHRELTLRNKCSAFIIGFQYGALSVLRRMKEWLAKGRFCCCLRNIFHSVPTKLTTIEETVQDPTGNGNRTIHYKLYHKQPRADLAEFSIVDVTGLRSGHNHRVDFIFHGVTSSGGFRREFCNGPLDLFKAKVLQVVDVIARPVA